MIFIVFLLSLIKDGKKRFDGSPSLPYYTPEDLGLKEGRFFFYSGKNKLYGSRYFTNKGPYKGVLVFFHGIGAGRTSYLKEISLLAKEGYLVYAYDNTGCMQSEGKGYIGLGQTNYDIEAFFHFLDMDPLAKGYKRFAVGHSWGGYSAFCSLKQAFKVSKIVSISGFISPKEEITSIVKICKRGFFRFIFKKAIGFYFKKKGNSNAIDLIENTDSEVLYIQGTEDQMVPFKRNGLILKKHFEGLDRVKFLLVEGMKHQPQYTKESEDYLEQFTQDKKSSTKEGNSPHLNIEKATKMNPLVFASIIDFLNK